MNSTVHKASRCKTMHNGLQTFVSCWYGWQTCTCLYTPRNIGLTPSRQCTEWVLPSNTDYKFMQRGCQCLSGKRLEEGRRTALQQRHVPPKCAIVSIGDTAQEERGCTFHSYTGSVVGGPDLLRRLFIYICDHSTWIIKSTDKTGAYGEDLQCVSSQAPSWRDHNVAKPGIRHKNGRM